LFKVPLASENEVLVVIAVIIFCINGSKLTYNVMRVYICSFFQ